MFSVRSRHALTLCAALLAAVALSACARASNEPNTLAADPWVSGGQTGSLIPRCGLAPAVIEEGVPASAEGFVVYADDCEGSFALSALSLQDEMGRRIEYGVSALADGAVLITPASALAAGSYRIGQLGAPAQPDDADAGADATGDDDAGIAEPTALAPGETLRVSFADATDPLPVRLGALTQTDESCGPDFVLELDHDAREHLSLFALELQIDDGAPQPYIAYGTLQVEYDGRAHLLVPEALWRSLSQQEHTLTLLARIAGEDLELRASTAFVAEDCFSYGVPDDEETSGCSALYGPRGGRVRGAGAWLLGALSLLALRKRRRRPSSS